MKFFCKFATVLAVFTLFFTVTNCKNSTSSDDGMTKTKLETPTNLVVNSVVDASMIDPAAEVNISFDYNGKFDGATYGILGYSTTNDSSKAIYDSYNSTVTVEAGKNTRTATIQNLHLVSGRKYYFWLKVTSSNNNISDSGWSNVAEFTYSE